MCSCTLGASMRRGNSRSLLCCHLGDICLQCISVAQIEEQAFSPGYERDVSPTENDLHDYFLSTCKDGAYIVHF